MIDENKKNYEKKIFEKEQEKLNIKKLKDKLLQLNVDGRINDFEFQESNNKYNENILEIDRQIEKIKSDKEINNSMKVNVEKIVSFLNRELDIEHSNFDKETIDSFLDKIIIKPESTKEVVQLQVILKIGNPYEAMYNRHNISQTLKIKTISLEYLSWGRTATKRSIDFVRKYGNTPFRYPVSFIIEYAFVA